MSEIAQEIMQEKKEISAEDILKYLLRCKGIKPFFKDVKRQNLSGVIYVPKKYIGVKAMIIVEDE